MIMQALLGLLFLNSVSNGYGTPNANNPIPSLDHFETMKKQAPAAPRVNIPIFKPSEFLFFTIVPDDGTDKAGGWQQAKANLEFIRVDLIPPGVTRWKCPITIKMPLRTEKMGPIPPSLAATMSAGIANMVTIGMDFELPQGIFCDRFVRGVELTFKATYPLLGSRVTP